MEQIHFKRLSLTDTIKPFDCGDSDLNDFLLKEAQLYIRERLAVTYILENGIDTIAYYCVLNDKVSKVSAPKNLWRKLRSNIPHRKHISSYPSVKIGRLAVSAKYKKKGIGSNILNAVIFTFSDENNRTGCRFVTVDAYREALSFYEKSGFTYLSDEDEKQETRFMYFDLKAVE